MKTATDTPPRRRGPKLPELALADDERATLQRWARRAKSSQALALRVNRPGIRLCWRIRRGPCDIVCPSRRWAGLAEAAGG